LRCRIVGSTISDVSPSEPTTTYSTGDHELRRRIDELERELEQYREQEQLVSKALVAATSHATAIRESARRDAELTLRKARAEAAKTKSAAERERDHAMSELMRLRKITEQMRSGLSAFLTATVEELRHEEGGDAQTDGKNPVLESALASVVNRHSSTAGGSAAAPTSDLATEIHRGGHPISGSPDDRP
jgi:cell division septum initiation protein DivIVA